MTYEEYKKLVENIGCDFAFRYSSSYVGVTTQDLGAVMGGNAVIALVSKADSHRYQMFSFDETPLDESDWKAINDASMKLAMTPLDKRGLAPKRKFWWSL